MLTNRTRVRSGRAALAVAAVGVATLTTFAVGAPAANAAPVHPQPTLASQSTFVLPAGQTLSAQRGSVHIRATAAPNVTATCTINVWNPFRYYGGPYGGGEEGLANIQCTQVVAELDIAVALFRNGVQVTYDTNTSYSSLQVVMDTEYPVSAGNYVTGAIGSDNATTWDLPEQDSPSVYLS